MRLALLLLLMLLLSATAAGVQPRILQVNDSLGNVFNVAESPSGNVAIYGQDLTRYVRIMEEVEIGDGAELQACVEEVEGEGNLTFNYMLQTYDHPDNTPIDQPVPDRCYRWEVNHSDFQDKLHVSIWARNQDSKYAHSNFSETDSFVELRYEDVEKVERGGGAEPLTGEMASREGSSGGGQSLLSAVAEFLWSVFK